MKSLKTFKGRKSSKSHGPLTHSIFWLRHSRRVESAWRCRRARIRVTFSVVNLHALLLSIPRQYRDLYKKGYPSYFYCYQHVSFGTYAPIPRTIIACRRRRKRRGHAVCPLPFNYRLRQRPVARPIARPVGEKDRNKLTV